MMLEEIIQVIPGIILALEEIPVIQQIVQAE